MVDQCGSQNAGVCLDAFHFQTGPSKLEDLEQASPELIAWVQLCDVSGTPRELAGDSDRICRVTATSRSGPSSSTSLGSATTVTFRSNS